MTAKQIAKWETFKTKTAEINHMINYTGRNGMTEALKDYEAQYKACLLYTSRCV